MCSKRLFATSTLNAMLIPNAAMCYVQDMVSEGKIRHLGLTNFDTKRLELITNKGINIVSNQVQYSMLDTRPAAGMAAVCKDRGVQLLCYGTLLGGLLSDRWLGKSAPVAGTFDTVSQQKYYNMIRMWGGWPLFQELLQVCHTVAEKHGVSVSD
jgi:aryl-alcohol dehydrogenase-like predicted oxidoreductase